MANQAWQVEYRLSIWKAMLLPSPEQTLRKPGTQEKAHRGVPCFPGFLRGFEMEPHWAATYTSSEITRAPWGRRYCGRPVWSGYCCCGSMPRTWKIVAIRSLG